MIADLWLDALAAVVLRHPNGHSRPILRIERRPIPELYVGLDETTCTKTGGVLKDFAISTVRLCIWPGTKLAQQWIAAAWVGYLQHEALELVTASGRAVLDPHAEPYAENPVNRGLRDGFPVELTYRTLVITMAIVLGDDEAERWVGDGWPSDAIVLQM